MHPKSSLSMIPFNICKTALSPYCFYFGWLYSCSLVLHIDTAVCLLILARFLH